jgi:glycosyltransferase involved in cell wall biosynthesis
MVKVLAINDMASVMSTVMKYVDFLDLAYQPSTVSHTFSKVLDINERGFKIHAKSYSNFIDFIRSKKDSYDLFHCCGWVSVAAYLAGVPYGIHFHGDDLRLWRKRGGMKRVFQTPLFERVLKKADYVVVSTHDLLKHINRYREDAINIGNPVDVDFFSKDAHKIDLPFKKPIIFCPTRLQREKGHEIMWLAIREAKSDFVVLQSDWGFEPYWSEMKKNAPGKVQFIDLIPRNSMPSYYVSVTGVLGQVHQIGALGVAELEAASCGTAVLSYTSIDSPFLPKNIDSIELAKWLDCVVEDEDFRKKLADDERSFVLKNHDSRVVAERWRVLWEAAIEKSSRTDKILPWLVRENPLFRSLY